MALKMRATGLSSPVDEHLTDFTVLTGEWVIGRIYEVRGAGMTVARSALSPSSPAPAPRAAKAALGLDRSAGPSKSRDLSDNVR